MEKIVKWYWPIPPLIVVILMSIIRTLGQNVKAKVSKVKTIYSKSGIPGYIFKLDILVPKPSNGIIR